jgi:hypothetical protein
MRALSLWQPWASLWCSPRKIHETRGWFTAYRGPLAVHAAKRRITNREYLSIPKGLRTIVEDEFGVHWANDLPYGAIVGVVNLERCLSVVDVYDTIWFSDELTAPDDYHCGDFSPGRYAWRRAPQFELLKQPIPYLGKQGFFQVPDEMLRRAA